MIYPYISFLNNHFSNIFAIFAFNETSKIVKQDHAQETTQGNPHRLRRLPATRLPSGRKVPAPDRLPAAHRTTGNRITAAEPHPLYPGWGLPLLPRLRSRHLRTGFHRNAEPDVPGAIPAIHVDTHVPDVTPTSSGEGANFHSHLKSKGSC